MRRNSVFLLMVLFMLPFLLGAQWPPREDLDHFIQEKMEAGKIPGLAASIIKNGEVVWSKGYGWANIEERIPVTKDTLFMLASISKTITAAAIMQLFDAGLFELDDDINEYLPFSVAHPKYLEESISFRMLLTHTSAVRDNWPVLNRLYTEGDSPLTLHDFLEGYLTPEGKFYSRILNFAYYQPGNNFMYSNVAVALIGYLAEVISGIPFDEYTEENIFIPLEMDESSWHLRDLDVSHIAVPYKYKGLNRYEPYEHYDYADYPSGALRTSVLQLSRFLISFINFGAYKSEQILEKSTVEEMRRVQYPEINPEQGLIWYYKSQRGRTVIGHNGGDLGVATEMFFRPEDGVGVILLANSNTGIGYIELLRIENRLFEEGDKH